MRRKTPGETEEMTFSVYNELFPCNNSSVTAVAVHQDLDCGGGVVRKIIHHLCQDSQHWPHRYEALIVNHSTVAFAAFHLILFKWNTGVLLVSWWAYVWSGFCCLSFPYCTIECIQQNCLSCFSLKCCCGTHCNTCVPTESWSHNICIILI